MLVIMKLFICLVLSAGVCFRPTTQTITPRNVVALEGDANVIMNCTFTDVSSVTARKWYKATADATNQLPSGSGLPTEVAGSYTVKEGTGTDDTNFTISSAKPEHADKYICEGVETAGQGKSATSAKSQLEILTPECNVVIDTTEATKLKFTCVATYAKIRAPTLAFSPAVEVSTTNRKSTAKTVTTTGTKSLSEVDEGSEWKCRASLTAASLESPNDVDATNDITNMDICKLTMAKPSGISITSKEEADFLKKDDELTCEAQGTPAPTYSWKDSDGKDLEAAGKLTVGDDLVGQSVTCKAENSFGSVTLTFPEGAGTRGTVSVILLLMAACMVTII